MIITYYGNQFFKIAQGDTVVAINPPAKDGKNGKDAARFGSVLALSTTMHPDFNGFDRVTLGAAVPFCISGPGEYEHSDISVLGTGTTKENLLAMSSRIAREYGERSIIDRKSVV